MMQTGGKRAGRTGDAAVTVEIVSREIEGDGEHRSTCPHSGLEARPTGRGEMVIVLPDGLAPQNTDGTDWREDESLDGRQRTRQCCKDGNAEPPPAATVRNEQ